MEAEREIREAVAAHEQWKKRLISAIDDGACDSDPCDLERDDSCPFGAWLHNGIASYLKISATYAVVMRTHADFHREAARVLRLALEGKRDEALRQLGAGSFFSRSSDKLASLLMLWNQY